MAASPFMRRALLYVPSSSSRFLEKTRNLKVDTIAYDLEDSVTPSKKPEARIALRKFLEGSRPSDVGELAVRINSCDTKYALDDLTEVLQAPNIDTLVVPKVNSPSDLHFVTDVVRHTLCKSSSSSTPRKAPSIIALIESARALTDLNAICRASPHLSGLIFAAEDFALDLSITRTPSLTEFLFARSAIVTAARAFELPSAIDLVCTQYKGEPGIRTLEEECQGGKNLGFSGKQVIHPSQVEVVQRVYGPSEEEVEWAVRVVVADEKADKAGRGAWTLDGKMIDAPVSGKARSIVKKAKSAGWDVNKMREKWEYQGPE